MSQKQKAMKLQAKKRKQRLDKAASNLRDRHVINEGTRKLDNFIRASIGSGSLRVEEAVEEEVRWEVEPPQITNRDGGGRIATFDIIGVIWEGAEREFRNQLRNMGRVNEVVVNINSPGGDFDASMSIAESLMTLDVPVTTRVVGSASSGGSIILQAGTKERVVCSTGRVMIHEVQPTEEQVRNFLKRVEDANDVMRIYYADTNTAEKSVDDIQAFFEQGDTHMTGKEAVANGFADRVESVADQRDGRDDDSDEGDESTSNEATQFVLTLRNDFDPGKASEIVSSGLSALESKRKGKKKTKAKKKPSRLPSRTNKSTPPPTAKGSTVDEFEAWLDEEHRIDVNDLSDQHHRGWLAHYNATVKRSSTPPPTNRRRGDGAAGDDGANTVRDEHVSILKRTAMLKSKLGDDDELVAKALDENWSDETIKVHQLEKKLAKHSEGGEYISGRDFAVITSKGSAKDLKDENVMECAFSRTLGVPYNRCKDLYKDLDPDGKENVGAGITNLRNFDDATYEAAGKLMVRGGGQIDIRHLACAINGYGPFAGFDIESDLSNAFSNTTFLRWLKDCVNRTIVANYLEAALIYPSIVHIVNGTYRKTRRYRNYHVGHMRKVLKGGTIQHGELAEGNAYDTNLERYGMILSIDECHIEEGDIGTIQGLLQGLANTARRAPEEVLFDMINEKHCDSSLPNNKIQFNQDWWDGAWETWCDCTIQDPKDLNNAGCNRPVPLDGMMMQMMVHKINALKARRMMNGAVQVCGDSNNEECTVVYTGNLYGQEMNVVTSSRLGCRDGAVLMPAANATAPAYVMSVRNGVRVPIIRRFDPPVNKLSIDLQAVFKFGIDEADEHLQKNASDVNAYIAARDEAASP